MRELADAIAGPGPELPVYQDTVFAEPSVSAVGGEPLAASTRCGGEPKKSFPAATAEAATKVVFESVPTALFNAVFRLAAVSVGVAPIEKLPAGGGVAL